MPDNPVTSPASLERHATAAYRVLARTYRPQRLSELIGQDALVRTLTNAFHNGRIAHAFLLTGIRGIGKTTTARIIARALNCTGPDGRGQPTPEPCGTCDSCLAIADGRHMDVLEMDAATRTGIDDIRELVDSVRYAPSSARYKVYIIDEIHMLSEKAFNGLLKTLEEPPPQTIFVFATTEVRKVPVTVLSRCQRFDLKRVDGETLRAHLAAIAAKEQVRVEPGALELIVRAAEGSVRDGLSLLDQAIALAGERTAISAAQVHDMLGLADRSRVLDLFEVVMHGEPGGALERLGQLHALGTEPEIVVQELLEITHWLTRIKIAPEAAEAMGVGQTDVARARAMADRLAMPVLARTWQMLLRGLDELRLAPDPLPAAEMLLVRLAYVEDLPPPSELARLLTEQADSASPALPAEAAPAEASGAGLAEPPPAGGMLLPAEPQSFAEAVELFRMHGEPMLHGWLYGAGHLAHFEPGRIELSLAPGTPPDLTQRIAAALSRWTARPWSVHAISDPARGAPTLAQQAEAHKRARIDTLAADPRLRPVLESFPGAKIVDVRPAADPQPAMFDQTTERP